MATGMGQGGKVCFYHCYWSHLCCKVCPQLKRRCGRVEGLSDILMLFVGSPELLVCNLFRILITFQCCLLVLFSNCINVSNCILLKMLIRYQRNWKLFDIEFNKGSSRVRERIYHVIFVVLLPDLVEQALKTFKSIEKLFLILRNVLGEEILTVFDILWYLKLIYERSTTKKIFSYVEQFFLKVLSKEIICCNIDNDQCDSAYLFHIVILPFEKFKI